MKPLLITLLVVSLTNASFASLGGTAISIEFVDELPSESPHKRLTFEITEIEVRTGEWIRRPLVAFEGKVIQSDLSEFKKDETFLAAFEISYSDLEQSEPGLPEVGDIISVDVHKVDPPFESYKFSIIENKKSNQSVQATEAKRPLFHYPRLEMNPTRLQSINPASVA